MQRTFQLLRKMLLSQLVSLRKRSGVLSDPRKNWNLRQDITWLFLRRLPRRNIERTQVEAMLSLYQSGQGSIVHLALEVRRWSQALTGISAESSRVVSLRLLSFAGIFSEISGVTCRASHLVSVSLHHGKYPAVPNVGKITGAGN